MVTIPTITPSKMAIITTTNTAKRAPWGLPAPNSFETLVLEISQISWPKV